MKTNEKSTGQCKKIIMILFHMSMKAHICFLKTEYFVYVVVIFLSQVIFVFLLFLGMIMYANEVETKGKIKIT